MKTSFLRFLTSGAVNTAFTYAMYALLLFVVPYRVAYTVAFASGIALAYLLYRYYVFQTVGRPYAPIWVVIIYGAQYAVGLVLVTLWSATLRLPELLAPVFAIAITLPLTYLLNRLVFRERR